MSKPAIIIETQRLRLRRWLPNDLTPFSELNADLRVMEYFPASYTAKQTREMIESFEKKLEADGLGFWALELKTTGEFLGFTGLNRPEGLPFSPCVEIGWRLAFAFWGNGYAQEAARAALEYGFVVKGLPEIVSFTAAGNLRSRRVMEAIGMTRAMLGDFEHPKVPQGHPLRPHVLYRLANPAPIRGN